MRLKDRYQIERQLGRGAIGIVFLARDLQLMSKPVVIKVLSGELGKLDDGSWLKKKFRQEIEALARIDHPGIVGALDTGQMPDGTPYLVMQFIEGSNLRSAISGEGMEFLRVSAIVKQIAKALGAAHDKGIYHRDLKPENIMIQNVDGEEVVKLIDFGIAKIKDSQVTSGTEGTKVAGTISYMAPEQLMGKPSASSDIYALGVVTYEMVTGRRPFNPDSPYQLLELQRAGVKVRPKDLRQSLPFAAQDVILKALSFNQSDRFATAREYGDELVRALSSQVESPEPRPEIINTTPDSVQMGGAPTTHASVAPNTGITTERVAILYKRNAQPDERLLKLLEQQLLANGYKVFIDRHLTIGVEWAREIERQVSGADAVITLLSATSVSSEMLAYEVQIAQEAAQKRQGKPRLLPVRVAYEGALPDPLAAILDPLQYALWSGPQDDSRLVSELLMSLKAPPASPAAHQIKMEPVGGAVPLDSRFYIVRPTDEEFHSAIARQDSIVLVKGARQMGKTSLLARGLQQARGAGARVILTDFQKMNSAHLETVETFFQTLAELIADQLDLDAVPEQFWSSRRGPSINFERYIRREVLGRISGPIVWGLDEVDRLFACDYGSEVFGLFRSWHNERSLDPTGPWQRLTLAIAYATEAHLFITDINQSPFNVGTRLALEDFTFEQVSELNRRYDSPLQGTSEVARFFRLVGGHPYLVRRSLHEMVAHKKMIAEFEAIADRDEGPLGDHLRRILVLLAQDSDLSEMMREILRGRPCPSNEGFYRLRSAGVISGDSPRDARPRCQLYAIYLERHLL
jgi:serine/threonine protein kinase